jgi:predicted enzyme related to lactoylglutathione lyase
VADYHGRFVWYELITTDVERARSFYANVLGWGTQEVAMPGMAYTLFTVGEASVSGLMNLPEDAKKMGAKPRWIGYVGVDDVDATTDLIKQLGGAIHLPPTDFYNFSRFAVVADPQTATFGLISWLRPGHSLQAELDMPGRVGWHELLAADREKALAFYSALFGWQRAEANVGPKGTYQLFSSGQQRIGGMVTKPSTVSVSSWVYYFNVGDIDAAAKRVKAGAGQILEGPIEVPDGSWIFQCLDPQGAMFALVGKRRYKAIVRFAPAESRDPSDSHFRLRKQAHGECLYVEGGGLSGVMPRPIANSPTGPSTWNSIRVILANRSILTTPMAHPPNPMSVTIM